MTGDRRPGWRRPSDTRWADGPTDLWSTLVPGQRHPSEAADLRVAAEEAARRAGPTAGQGAVYRSAGDGDLDPPWPGHPLAGDPGMAGVIAGPVRIADRDAPAPPRRRRSGTEDRVVGRARPVPPAPPPVPRPRSPATEPAWLPPRPLDAGPANGGLTRAGPAHARPGDAGPANGRRNGAGPLDEGPADAGSGWLRPRPRGGGPAGAWPPVPPTDPAGERAGAAGAVATRRSPVAVPTQPPFSAPTSPAPASPAPGPPARNQAPIPTAWGPANHAESASSDPEQILANHQWRLDPETLREVVDERQELHDVSNRLTEKLGPAQDNASRARLLGLRAVAARLLGALGKAHSDAKLALVHAEATGELRRIAIARARLAHILRWRGEFAEADRLFALANSAELPDRLRATMHEYAGRSCYDQGRHMEACTHFERALDLRRDLDPALVARTELALDAVLRKASVTGLGPFPRTREELLGRPRPPAPFFDERTQLWGYATVDGEPAGTGRYALAQRYTEGVAWVRRPRVPYWELIDESGGRLVNADKGYRGAGPFADGLAWVSRSGTDDWLAIDHTGRVVVTSGFDDVRPFHRGVALVRRRAWGAIDRAGRVILPLRYAAFVTALADGSPVDGFTDEGLAVVKVNGQAGVADRGGRMIIAPSFPAIVIHPVAFLVADHTGRWGALDRRGQILIEPSHPNLAAVVREIDRLLVDTQPVL